MIRRRNQGPLPLAAVLAAGVGAGLGAGCLEGLEQAPPMCVSDGDCESGENCFEGICYGDPPRDLEFAAILLPPAPAEGAGSMLVETEIPSLAVSQEGIVSGLAFGQPIAVEVHVLLACAAESMPCTDDFPIDATIRIERPPSFAGGPGFARTFQTSGRADGQGSILHLPRGSGGYEVTVSPAPTAAIDVAGENASAGELAPPMRFHLAADIDQKVVWTLGRPAELKTVVGRVVVGAAGVPGYQITAFGRFEEGAKLERVSSKATSTDDGSFLLHVPAALSRFDIQFQPPTDPESPPLPTMRLRRVDLPAPSGPGDEHDLGELAMAGLAIGNPVKLPVVGMRGNGDKVAIPGAKVTLVTAFDAPLELPGDAEAEVLFVAQAETIPDPDDRDFGRALLKIPQTSRTYQVRVVAPVDSEFGSLFGGERLLSGNDGLADEIQLPRRIAVTGKVVSVGGEPIAGAHLSARLSPAFTWELDSQRLELLGGLSFPTAITDDGGHFFIWLDKQLVGLEPLYDLRVEPPANADAPRWSFDALPAGDLESRDLGQLAMPGTSWARGAVSDAGEMRVAGAQLRLYQIRDGAYCGHACFAPAYLRGTFEADAEGTVRLVLPDP
jgi:hypothetical protein